MAVICAHDDTRTYTLAILVAAGCNALWFHGRRSLLKLDLVARVQMLSSTAIWLAVVFCGRWIAY